MLQYYGTINFFNNFLIYLYYLFNLFFMNRCQQCHIIKIIKILKIIKIYLYTLYILPSAITCACIRLYNGDIIWFLDPTNILGYFIFCIVLFLLYYFIFFWIHQMSLQNYYIIIVVGVVLSLQTIQITSFFASYSFFYIIFNFYGHIKKCYKTINPVYWVTSWKWVTC